AGGRFEQPVEPDRTQPGHHPDQGTEEEPLLQIIGAVQPPAGHGTGRPHTTDQARRVFRHVPDPRAPVSSRVTLRPFGPTHRLTPVVSSTRFRTARGCVFRAPGPTGCDHGIGRGHRRGPTRVRDRSAGGSMSDPAPQARRRMRGHVIGQGGRWLAEWSLRLILIVGALWIIDLLVSRLWVMVLPVLLSLLLVSVLWPVTDWLRRHKVPPAAASGLTLLLLAGVGAGMVTMVAASVIDQSGELADKATQGLRQVQDWLTGPPVNLQPDQISGAIDSLVGRVQSSADRLAVGVFSGV